MKIGNTFRMKTDENGWENPFSVSVSTLFSGNGVGFGKAGIENGIKICQCSSDPRAARRRGLFDGSLDPAFSNASPRPPVNPPRPLLLDTLPDPAKVA